ncbi:MAG: 30S ribosomal protein S3 [bacterium]
MGQKTHPYGFRIGFNKTWKSRWFSKERYTQFLHQDLLIKKTIKDNFNNAGISRIEIERQGEVITVFIHTARPGLIIGRRGEEVNKMRDKLEKLIEGQVNIEIKEVQNPEVDAQLIAESIAQQLERRVSFRRAMKRAVETALRFGAKGVKVACSGRLGGGEIARTEWYKSGRIPLSTLRADIDYGFAKSLTQYGIIGVKAWIYKGEKLPEDLTKEMLPQQEQVLVQPRRPSRRRKRK